MNYYFAPLEGITGYIFRNTHHAFYPGVDRYYAPFISPAKEGSMTPREKNDLTPEHNAGICVVPQVMTNKADLFIRAVQDLRELGYHEVNLNLGCPSGTVTAKGKGAGFLARPDELKQFFDKVFSCREIADMQISVKTRLGKNDPEEFRELLKIYNWYPISELTVHPRIQKDFYKGEVRMQYFDYAFLHSENPLVYNGDLCSIKDIADKKAHIDAIMHPDGENERGLMKTAGEIERNAMQPDGEKNEKVTAMMLGRGLLKNPELIMRQKEAGERQQGKNDTVAGRTEVSRIDYVRLKAFHDELYARYKEVMSPDKNVLYRMKELWAYLGDSFEGCEKQLKQIRKAEHYAEYDGAVTILFQNV